jgi:hypothetical protein
VGIDDEALESHEESPIPRRIQASIAEGSTLDPNGAGGKFATFSGQHLHKLEVRQSDASPWFLDERAA